ncbi:MAG: helical backbone metal receptor [Bacteroidota bacterium]
MKSLLYAALALMLFVSCEDSRRKAIESAPFISRTFTDDQGTEISLKKPPQRLVSLAPNITEMIFAIGAEGKLVGRSEACNYPYEVVEIDEVSLSPVLDVNFLLDLKPDLVFTTDESFTREQIDLLRREGLTIYVQSYRSLADIYDRIIDLGHILGVQERAVLVSDSLSSLEARIVDSTEIQVQYGTMMLVGNQPLEMVGSKGILGEILSKSGAKNVFANVDSAFVHPTEIQALEKQPEFLIIPSTDDQSYANLLTQYPALYNTPADALKQVYVIDPEILYRPGPRILEGLMELTQILHNRLKKEAFLE